MAIFNSPAISVGTAGLTAEISKLTDLDVFTTVRNDYSVVNVTTGAFVTLVADTGAIITRKIQIFDSSGETMELSLDAVNRKLIVTPGGNGDIDVLFPVNSTVSIRAVSADATVGEIDINFIG